MSEKNTINSLLSSANQGKIIKPKSNLSQTVPLSRNVSKSVREDTSSQRQEAKAAFSHIKRRVANEDLFDQFMEKAQSSSISDSLESILKIMFHSEAATVWISNPEKQILFSQSLHVSVPTNLSIQGYVLLTNSILQISDIDQVPPGFTFETKYFPTNSINFFFPLSIYGVVQITRRNGVGGFEESEMDAAQLIIHKFSIYGSYLFSSSTLVPAALHLFSTDRSKINPIDLLKSHFQSQIAEIWKLDNNRQIIYYYDSSFSELIPHDGLDIGIVSQSLSTRSIINVSDPKHISSYNDEFDGKCSGPFLSVSVESGRNETWAIALRGRSTSFTSIEVLELSSIIPFIVRSITGFGNERTKAQLSSIIGDLLDVFSMILCILSIKELEKIVEDQITEILDCEKAKLIRFKSKSPPKDGICGMVYYSKITQGIDSINSSMYYRPEIDGIIGFDPKSYIAYPLFNPDKETIGIIFAYNKRNASNFEDIDSELLKVLSSFVEISLNHSITLRRLIKISKAVISGVTIDEFFKMIGQVIKSDSICLFMKDDEWSQITSYGIPIKKVSYDKIISSITSTIQTIRFPDDPKALMMSTCPIYSLENKMKHIIIILHRKPIDDIEIVFSILSEFIKSKYTTFTPSLKESTIDMNEEQTKRILDFSIEFDSLSLLERFQFAFFSFRQFNLLDTFQISNESFHRFLIGIQVSIESIRILNFLVSFLHNTRDDYVFDQQQKFALLLSSFMSDYTIINGIESESSFVIKRIGDFIRVLANSESNILCSFNESDTRNMFQMIVSLVNATDPLNCQTVLNDLSNTEDTSDSILSFVMCCASLSPLLKGDSKLLFMKFVNRGTNTNETEFNSLLFNLNENLHKIFPQTSNKFIFKR